MAPCWCTWLGGAGLGQQLPGRLQASPFQERQHGVQDKELAPQNLLGPPAVLLTPTHTHTQLGGPAGLIPPVDGSGSVATHRQVGQNSGRLGTVRLLRVSTGVQAGLDLTALQHTDTHTHGNGCRQLTRFLETRPC